MTLAPTLPHCLRLLIAVCSACFSLLALGDETKAIRDTIQHQWSRPDLPVEVFPIAISSPYAIAGWQQADKGGHALLYQHAGQWQVLFCGGQALTTINALTQSGLDNAKAKQLIEAWHHASLGLSEDKKQSLNSFEGIMPVNGDSSQVHHH